MSIVFKKSTDLDVILMGRAGADLNAVEINRTFEETKTFTKTLGGSPANIAAGLSKLGVKAGFIGKVTDNGIGRFVTQSFDKLGIDHRGVLIDKDNADNAIAFTEIRSPYDCTAYLYRANVADMKIMPEEIDEEYVKSAKMIMISGTALSKSPSREAVFRTIQVAKQNGVKVGIDLDYRQRAWSSKMEASIYYGLACEKCDIIIGNREEFNVLEHNLNKDNKDEDVSSKYWLDKGSELVIIKHGEDGSNAYTKDEHIKTKAFLVEAKKTFGAGDSYAAALIAGLLQGKDLLTCIRMGSASAAIVVGGYDCSESMPIMGDIREFLANRGIEI
jgi:5-dehydro-2-deoxygluconokinase